MDIIICCDFLKTKLTGDLSAEVVAADSVMGWVNSVVSTIVTAQVSTIVSAQTVSVSVSTGSIGVSTISITVVGSGLSFSMGSDDKGGDNCNKGLHVAFVLRREAP